MPRNALKIEYHGGPFAGWQRQSQGLASVQGAVEAALAKLEPGPHTIAAAPLPLSTDGRHATLVLNGIRRRIAYHLDGNQLWLPGLTLTNRTQQVASRQADTASGSGSVKAPMDGAIVDVRVCAGEHVSKGQLLLVLEAMKMEHPLKACMDGVVKAVQVTAGDQVRNRQVLLEIE